METTTLRLAGAHNVAHNFGPVGSEFVIDEQNGRILDRAGRVIAASLTPSDVHLVEELPTYFAGYANDDMCADLLSPVIPVDYDKFQYRTGATANAFRRVPVKTGITSKFEVIDPTTSLAEGTVQRRALGALIPASTEAQAKYNLRQVAAELIAQKVLLDRELDVVGQLSTSTNFASAQRKQLAATYNWNGGVNSDPIKDLQERIAASYQKVHYIVMNYRMAATFLRHPAVREYMKQFFGDAAPTMPTENAMTGTFERIKIPLLPPIIVCESKVEAVSSSSVDYIWPDGVVALITQPPGAPTDGKTIATARTFRLKGPQGTGYTVREYVVNETPEPSTMLVCTAADVSIITANNAGGIIYDAYV